MYNQRVSAVPHTSWWRLVILPLIVAAIVVAVLPGIFTAIFALLLGIPLAQAISLASAIGMGLSLILGALLMKKSSTLTWDDLGFTRKYPVRYSLIGVAIGALLLVAVALILNLIGAVSSSYVFTSAAIAPIAVAALFFLFQGVWEELVYRAYLMPHFSKKFGDFWSITITIVLFALFHAANPGMRLLPAINLLIFGFVFALLYWRTGNMWITGLSHSAWNFCQGFLMGSEVSGNASNASVFRSPATPGYDLISGGSFGFEGGLVTTVTGIVLIIFLLKFYPQNKIGHLR